MQSLSCIEAKAHILSHGVKITDTALSHFDQCYLGKRRIYSNMDDLNLTYVNLPQEIVILPLEIIAGTIFKMDSPWKIDYKNGHFLLSHKDYEDIEIDFTHTPSFYGMKLTNGLAVESVLTFMFGHTLGIFANTNCYFEQAGKPCKFCSISCNAARPQNAENSLNIDTTCEAVTIALKSDNANMIKSIFISGGNYSNNDSNYKHYIKLALAIRRVTITCGRADLRVTINCFPPNDLTLINGLHDMSLDVLVSTEIFNELRFSAICPGKSQFLKKKHLKEIMEKYVRVLGCNHVFSIVIHGLEEDETLLAGIREYAEMGVCTIVNVLHVDPGTEIEKMKIPPPSPERIITVAKYLQEIYKLHNFNSLYAYGGRSSFDSEVSRHLL